MFLFIIVWMVFFQFHVHFWHFIKLLEEVEISQVISNQHSKVIQLQYEGRRNAYTLSSRLDTKCHTKQRHCPHCAAGFNLEQKEIVWWNYHRAFKLQAGYERRGEAVFPWSCSFYLSPQWISGGFSYRCVIKAWSGYRVSISTVQRKSSELVPGGRGWWFLLMLCAGFVGLGFGRAHAHLASLL